MTYAQALMIVRNANDGYTQAEIRKAANFVLDASGSNEEDCLDAGSALGYANMMGVEVGYMRGARCGELDAHPFSGAISAGDY